MVVGISEVTGLVSHVDHDRVDHDVDAGTKPVELHRDRIDEKWEVVGDDHHDRMLALPTIDLAPRVDGPDSDLTGRPGATQLTMIGSQAEQILWSSRAQIFGIDMGEVVPEVLFETLVGGVGVFLGVGNDAVYDRLAIVGDRL